MSSCTKTTPQTHPLSRGTFTAMSEHFSHTNPKPFLRELVNHPIVVTLKFNKTQYKGNLVSTDNYFNLQLSDAEEVIDGKSKGKVGEIFIRCNNVLWIGKDLAKVENPTVIETEGAKSENTSPAQ